MASRSSGSETRAAKRRAHERLYPHRLYGLFWRAFALRWVSFVGTACRHTALRAAGLAQRHRTKDRNADMKKLIPLIPVSYTHLTLPTILLV